MDEPITKNDINSELTGLNKGEKEKRRKQIIIGAAVGGIFFILIIIMIIIIIIAKSDSNDSEEEKTEAIGEINCIYDIQTSIKSTLLLGNDFQKNSEFDIYVDGTKIKYEKEYKFNSVGFHNVSIKIYQPLNMNYMFKDIRNLLSVEMKSEKNIEIISMISTFENCENMNKFSIKGFNGEKIKSLHKLFYNNGIKTYNFESFNKKILKIYLIYLQILKLNILIFQI